jgi:ribonuclease HI
MMASTCIRGKADLLKISFLRNNYPRRARIKIFSSKLLPFSSAAEFLTDGHCVAIMEGQPWAAVSSTSPYTSKEIKTSTHHKKTHHNNNATNSSSTFTYSLHNESIVSKLRLSPEKTYCLRVKGHTTSNSGGAGIGIVLEDSILKRKLWSARMYVSGDRTVFEAEYSAIILGIDYAINVLKTRRLIVSSTNDVIVNQIRGVFTVTKSSLKVLLDVIKTSQQKLQEFTIDQIPLEENSEASVLAMKALATRKSLNIDDKDWKVDCNDPIQMLQRNNPPKIGRWKQPDDPAQSVIIDPSRQYLLQFDGGARVNGISGAGVVIYDDESGKEIWCGYYFHPEPTTNNVSEYIGLICGMECARSLGIKKLIVEGDSLLVVRQMNGIYRTREVMLELFREEALQIVKDLSYCQIRYIPRAENKRADWLANHAMNLKESGGFIRGMNDYSSIEAC